MASRTLTDLFLLMRNNAIQSRLIYQEQNPLFPKNNANSLTIRPSDNALPPKWSKELDRAQYELRALQSKIRTLKELQYKNLYKPSLDDNSSEEKQIEDLTREITLILGAIHKVIQIIKSEQQLGGTKEKMLRNNIVRTLVLSLQEHTSEFRSLQNSYLEQIKSREKRLNFFDISDLNFNKSVNLKNDQNSNSTTDDIDKNFMAVSNKTKTNESSTNLTNDNFDTSSRRSSQFSLDKMKILNKDDCKIS